ncbi:flagellar hook-length control protein FliK [Nocardioides sp. T2.26MG-1]|uniref:flagellar hook-length control protein FliK n=1 Tax=Nocardioides sp. T2.26MG-1 TaxID=3041166 RepID=UPI0024777CB4|nr:flagellar hook-length control protein FliK [Nocardioides sp. T2.26MG-1]CAI9399304.1 hypothetical protein HIDPHFAB_00168 [Nocardioides sp. T2.26MG-1]
MTTIPIGATVPAIDQGAPGSPGNTGGGDVFLALVQGLLDAQPVLPPLAQPGSQEATEAALGEVVPGEAEEQSADAGLPDPASAAALAGSLTSPLMTGLAAALVPGLVTPPSAPRAGDPSVTADLVGAGDAAPDDGLTALAGPSAEVSGAQTASAAAVPGPRPEPARPDLGATDTRPAATDATATDATATDATATDRPATTDQPATTPAAPPSATAPTAASAPTPAPTLAGVAAPTAPAAVGTAPTTPVAPVAHQVFPEVVKLTTSTDGPQRVTIRLNPEALGEVRVVLTERRGTLEVSLSAGSDARRALLEGTPELQRLLDAVGRGDSRIVVRDATGLPVTAPAPGSATNSSSGQTGPGTTWSGDLAGGAQTGAGRNGADTAPDQDRRHAPGGSTITDAIASATNRSRTTETVTGARPGLDVTM